MARPPSPPGVPTPTPTPRPCAPLPDGVSPADYFETCLDNLSTAIKNEESVSPDDILEWGGAVRDALRSAET